MQVCGFVEDLDPLYASADAVVLPLSSGSGTRIKLLEAFAHGVPVVASATAAEGLEVADGRHLLLAADAQAIAAAVASLDRDAALAQRLVEHALALVRERYSSAVVSARIRAFLAGQRARRALLRRWRPREPAS